MKSKMKNRITEPTVTITPEILKHCLGQDKTSSQYLLHYKRYMLNFTQANSKHVESFIFNSNMYHGYENISL
jgi:hypothetical protein